MPTLEGLCIGVLPTHYVASEGGDDTRRSLTVAVPAMASVNEWRDQVERALLVIEDDILPFTGRRLTAACMDALAKKAAARPR